MKRTYPGSIFIDKGTLYIKLKGKKHSTGLKPTKAGYLRANELLEKMWMDYNKLTPLTKNHRIKEAFELFLNTKINRYERTLITYRYAFMAIITSDYYLDEDRIERDIQRFIQLDKYRPVTKNTYLSHLQWFLNYCSKKRWLPVTEFFSNYQIKSNLPEPDPWTPEECELIINHFKISNPEIALMIEFMLETGARIVDCLTMSPSDILGNSIQFYNKITKKPEIMPLTQKAQGILSKLPKRENQVWNWTYPGRSFLNKKLIQATDKLKIERKRRSFQEFRQAYRMKLITLNVPTEYTMFLMRHTDYKTTKEKYTKYKLDEIRKYIEKAG